MEMPINLGDDVQFLCTFLLQIHKQCAL